MLKESVNDDYSKKSELYLDDLAELQSFKNLGKKYIFKVGVNEDLAKAWVNDISSEAEVVKWTAEPIKRSTVGEILKRNIPGETKYIVTYSLWSEKGDLAAVAWYQIWEPGEEELKNITQFCKEEGIKNPIITTSAFRVALDFRRQGLAKKIISLTELFYPLYLSEKFKMPINILFTLETDEMNQAAAQTYKSNGYKIIGAFEQPEKETYRGKRLLMVKKHT